MTVGFFFVDTGTSDTASGIAGAKALMASVRRLMPGVEVVQFTDETTGAVEGVDAVRRLPREPLAVLRVRHQGAVTGEWLFVDTDVVIQREVRPVFDAPFDVAVTSRNWTHLKLIQNFAELMPFNTGVVFSRSPKFWAAVLAKMDKYSERLQAWMGDQQAICDVIASRGRFRVVILKGTRYNFPPAIDPDAEALKAQRKASILHFKGVERKVLLDAWVQEQADPCA